MNESDAQKKAVARNTKTSLDEKLQMDQNDTGGVNRIAFIRF